MQRLFSMFPAGLPGVALVLLRSSVALTILLQAYTQQEEPPIWLAVALFSLSVLLIVGFFTPILAMLAMSVQLLGILHGSLLMRALAGILLLNAAALALLGPGAYSHDARRFGRRVVELSSSEDQ
jgi:hypothetical protein